MRFALLLALGCTPAPTVQVIYGSVSGPAGPVSGASVNLQYFESVACKNLGAMTTDQTAAQQAELKRCSRRLPAIKTTARGAYETAGLKPGWYSVNFQWQLANKPTGNAAFGRYDGYIVMHTIGSRAVEEYFVVALANEPFELKPASRVEKKFTYRP